MTEEIMALCRAMGATEDQEGLLLPLAQASAQALERRLKPGTSPACVVPPSLWLPPCWLWMGWSGPWEVAECPPSPPEKCPSVWGERPERAA